MVPDVIIQGSWHVFKEQMLHWSRVRIMQVPDPFIYMFLYLSYAVVSLELQRFCFCGNWTPIMREQQDIRLPQDSSQETVLHQHAER